MDNEWRTGYEEPSPPATDRLPPPPEGWCYVTIRQLKEFSLYGPRYSSEAYSSEGPLVLRTSDISEAGKVNLETAPRISISKADLEAYRVLRGDLLITRTGSIGTLAVFDDAVDAIPGAYLIQYRLAAPAETSRFVFTLLKSPGGQRTLTRGAAGVGRPNLNAPTIESILIALPPLSEQARILVEVSRLLSLSDALELELSSLRVRLGRLRQAILKWAFEGKLVDQDPNDEPASVLLERIRSERAARAEEDGTVRARSDKRNRRTMRSA